MLMPSAGCGALEASCGVIGEPGAAGVVGGTGEDTIVPPLTADLDSEDRRGPALGVVQEERERERDALPRTALLGVAQDDAERFRIGD